MSDIEEKSSMIARQVKELPPLPIVVQKLLSIVGDAGSSANEVTKVLSGDQALAGKVLRLVNSSFYGLPGKVSTISRAVVILGNSAIRNLALGLAVCSTLKKLKGPIDWSKFWEHTLTCAVAAKVLSPRMNYDESEEAFIGGLLHDIGHLVCYVALPDAYSDLITRCKGDLLAAERKIFGVNHAEVGRNLLEHWQLPPKFCRLVRFHHDVNLATSEHERLLAVVLLADRLACASGSCFVDKGDVKDFQEACKLFKLRMSDCGSMLESISAKVDEVREFFDITDKASVLKGPSVDARPSIRVICADDDRRSWLDSLVRHFGYLPVSYPRIDNCTPEPVQATLLDLKGLKTNLSALTAFVSGAQEPFAVLLDDPTVKVKLPDALESLPRLPFAVNKDHLKALIEAR